MGPPGTKPSLSDFANVYEKYRSSLFKLALVRSKSKEDAEDIIQSVFTKYITRAPIFESEEHRRRWLLRVCINESKNLVGSFWKQKISALDECIEIADKNTPEQECLLDMFKLPIRFRTVLFLYYYERYTISEMSVILRTKQSTLASQLYRAREYLKLELEGDLND